MNENYIIKKSNYFIMNSNYDLSLEEQKLILTLASMVQPDDEEFKPYKFRIFEFMKLLGVDTKTKYTEVPKITKELMKKVFEIQEEDNLIQTAWISSAVYKKGSGYVELTFSPYLKPYMLKLNTMFTQYKLTNILSMKSKYSPRIYEILKCNEFKKQGYVELGVEELRKLLKAENIYPRYNDFKRKIILQTQKELKKISDISFEFEEIKTGRKVTSIKFYIKCNKKNNVKEEICATFEETNYIEQVKS
ncbi:replication initiation protein, partial [Clostridium tepidum]